MFQGRIFKLLILSAIFVASNSIVYAQVVTKEAPTVIKPKQIPAPKLPKPQISRSYVTPEGTVQSRNFALGLEGSAYLWMATTLNGDRQIDEQSLVEFVDRSKTQFIGRLQKFQNFVYDHWDQVYNADFKTERLWIERMREDYPDILPGLHTAPPSFIIGKTIQKISEGYFDEEFEPGKQDVFEYKYAPDEQWLLKPIPLQGGFFWSSNNSEGVSLDEALQDYQRKSMAQADATKANNQFYSAKNSKNGRKPFFNLGLLRLLKEKTPAPDENPLFAASEPGGLEPFEVKLLNHPFVAEGIHIDPAQLYQTGAAATLEKIIEVLRAIQATEDPQRLDRPIGIDYDVEDLEEWVGHFKKLPDKIQNLIRIIFTDLPVTLYELVDISYKPTFIVQYIRQPEFGDGALRTKPEWIHHDIFHFITNGSYTDIFFEQQLYTPIKELPSDYRNSKKEFLSTKESMKRIQKRKKDYEKAKKIVLKMDDPGAKEAFDLYLFERHHEVGENYFWAPKNWFSEQQKEEAWNYFIDKILKRIKPGDYLPAKEELETDRMKIRKKLTKEDFLKIRDVVNY